MVPTYKCEEKNIHDVSKPVGHAVGDLRTNFEYKMLIQHWSYFELL